MKVILSPRAEKQFKSIAKTAQIIIAKSLRDLEKKKSVKEEKLSGYKDIYRLRIGNYRIVYRKSPHQIFIILVGHRKEIYRLLRGLLK